jgi:hypothetical protein
MICKRPERLTGDSPVNGWRESPPNPAYLAGYEEWKRAFDEGRADIFTISVAEIVDVVEAALNKQWSPYFSFLQTGFASPLHGVPAHDGRDWDAICAWSDSLSVALHFQTPLVQAL